MTISDGQKVRTIRHVRGWRLIDLAKLAGIDAATLSSFERDQRQAHTSTRQKIEATFGFGLNDPATEAAFAILANDAASADAVRAALNILEML